MTLIFRCWQCLALAVAIGHAAPSAAQEATAVDVAVGFHALRDPRENTTGPRGIYGAVIGYISRWVGVVGEVGTSGGTVMSRHFGFIEESDLSIDLTHLTMLGGVRAMRPGRVRPFAQALFGLRRSTPVGCSNSVGRACTMLDTRMQKMASIFQPGGGVAITITRGLSVEGRGDTQLNLTPTEAENLRIEHPPRALWRFSVGAMLSFGS